MTREELFELVWSTPVTKVAKGLGITDVALAKRCRRESIPRPPRGYWAKIAAGQAIPRPELPPKSVKTPIVRTAKKPPAAAPSVPELKPKRAVRRYKNRLGRGDRTEMFWCKIERWQRFYSFGVNWRPWEFNEESWSEHDRLEIVATIRSKTSRPYQRVEVWLWPTPVPRDKINPDLRALGNVWMDRQKKGRLICGAHVPSDAFHSLCNAIARNEFAEVIVEVLNLTRGHGSTSEVSFRPELTDLSGDE